MANTGEPNSGGSQFFVNTVRPPCAGCDCDCDPGVGTPLGTPCRFRFQSWYYTISCPS
jgi:cyclophilin family peptidyl-prolyl cis-trans isomerase